MDEQMIELIARAMCGREIADVDCETACMAANKCVGNLSESIIADARAAHSVIAGKVAELVELLREARRTMYDEHRLSVLIDLALAPYPERRSE